MHIHGVRCTLYSRLMLDSKFVGDAGSPQLVPSKDSVVAKNGCTYAGSLTYTVVTEASHEVM